MPAGAVKPASGDEARSEAPAAAAPAETANGAAEAR
jgi:hypothetical protein